eukprot:m.74352 g.74352  ORF g.74352 m.74352 type:complete len:466 (-) comp13937_c0_seq1:217-1614(-)
MILSSLLMIALLSIGLVHAICPDGYENYDFDSARVIALASTQFDGCAVDNSTFFRLDGCADALQVIVTFDNNVADIDLVLYDAQRNEVDSSVGIDASETVTSPGIGPFYLEVVHFDGSETTFTGTISCVPTTVSTYSSSSFHFTTSNRPSTTSAAVSPTPGGPEATNQSSSSVSLQLDSTATSLVSRSQYTSTMDGTIAPTTATTENVSMSPVQDDEGANSFPSDLDTARQLAIAALGEQCTTAVYRALTSYDIIQCFQDVQGIDAVSDGSQALRFDSICSNQCLNKAFSAIDILVHAGCVRPVLQTEEDGLNVDDDDDTGALSLRLTLGYIAALHKDLGAMCARSSQNHEYCGNLFVDLVALALSSAEPTVGACNNVLAFGNCLGSLVQAFQADSSIFATSFPSDIDMLTTSLVQGCAAVGVPGLQAAAEATEAPSAFTSSGSIAAPLLSIMVAFAVSGLATLI